MTPTQQEYYSSRVLPITSTVFSSPVTYEPWLDIPCAFMICTLDNAIPVGLQRGMVGFLKGASPYPVTVAEIEASHSPFISVPQKVVEAVDIAAKAGAEQSAKKL